MMDMHIHHVCIQTNRYAESLRFYRDVLGMAVTEETADFHGRAYNTWLKGNGIAIELQTGKGSIPLSPVSETQEGLVHLCFYVPDLPKAYASLQSAAVDTFLPHNGQIIYEVMGGHLLKLRAPEGTIIEFRDSP